MDHELIAYLETLRTENAQQFAAVGQQFQSFRAEVSERLDRLDGQVRQTRVLLEDLRHELHLVAEGVMGLSERLAAYQSETLLKFDEVRASMVPYYQDLNRRVGILEGRADRQTRDIIDVIREKFGKPQA